MGFLQSILNTVKKVYKKADTAVGGYLPGGQTPAQVAAPVQPVQAPVQPATPFSFTGTYDKASSTLTSPTGQKQSIAATAPQAKAAKQINQVSQTSQASQPQASQPSQVTAPAPVQTPTQVQQVQPAQGGSVQAQPVKSYNDMNILEKYQASIGMGPKGQTVKPDFTGKINPVTGLEFTEADAPFGVTQNSDGSFRAITQNESGEVSQIDALDLAVVGTSAWAAMSAVSAFMSNSKVVGMLAQTPEGAQTIAQASPAAGGWLIEVPKAAGEVAVNSKTAATSISFLSKIATSIGMKPEVLGSTLKILGLTSGIGAITSSTSGGAESKTFINQYIKDSDDLQTKLRDAGMDDLADELLDSNKDLKDGLDTIMPYIPFIGKNIEKSKVEDYKFQLEKINNKYDKQVKTQIEAAKVEAEKQKATSEAASKTEQRQYNEEQQSEQRRYNEEQKKEQRTYNEEQQRVQEEKVMSEQLGADAIATESSGGSNLQFGLLSSGGAKEFVDKDKAAKYYFGKVYTELTQAQKMLMNMLKEQRE